MKHFLITIVFTIITFFSTAQQIRNFKQEANLLKNVLLQHHVQAKQINDKFSAQLFDAVLDDLDPDKLFFAQTDIKSLLPFRLLLDDELNGANWIFLNKLNELYLSCLKRAEYNITSTLDAPIKWDAQEFYHPDAKWQDDAHKLKAHHRLWLKYEILDKLSVLYERDSTAQPQDFFKKNVAEAIKRVKVTELRNIQRMLNYPSGLSTYTGEVFLRAMTGLFDAHSAYLSSRDLKKFMQDLSTEGYYYGVTLDENERGDITIASLQPGGPAWKSGELHVSDILISLQLEGQPPIDMTSVDIEEANKLLDDMNHTYMVLGVRKVDGIKKNVLLRKEKISTEENIVHSFILSGPRKIGYIFLPDFYTRWNDYSEGSQCANDVAKEIVKLKKDSIEALVLDVRYNGGGSLEEATAMAGIFIDEGTLGIVKDKTQKVSLLKDQNRGTVYDGPLLLMVNGQSASASEFLAAALQDYNRGLIVGSQTFGKATAQTIFPLDPKQKDLAVTTGSPHGYVSVTFEKLYRATGKSAQGRGVTPDIVLPDIFAVLNIHEDDMPNALQRDSVIKESYIRIGPPMPRYELQRRSNFRVESHPSFQKVAQGYKWLSEVLIADSASVLLSLEEYSRDSKDDIYYQRILKEAFTTPSTTFQVLNNSIDQKRLAVDDHAREFKRTWSDKLKNDIYVEECFHILCDYLTLQKKP